MYPRAMVTLRDLKARSFSAFAAGDAATALRGYDRVVTTQPLDADARMKVADCVSRLGHAKDAAQVYRAVAGFDLKAGHPLRALVAIRTAQALGADVRDLIDGLVTLYGSGSTRIGKLAARMAPPDLEKLVEIADLAAPPASAGFWVEAASRAQQATDHFTEYPAALHPIPLLSDLSEDGLRRVLEAILVRRLPHGAPIIREGEPGDSFFFVAGGEVRVFNADALGHVSELAHLHEGALFGEMALLQAAPRTASVEAVDEADLLEMGRDSLRGIANELDSVAAALDRFARERLIKNLMATSAVFRPFSRPQQLELLRRFTSHDVAAGTDIVREGDWTTGLYIVLSGEVVVSKRSPDGPGAPPVALATLRAGEVFGEMALLAGTTASATVTASRRATVLYLAREYFERLVEAVPALLEYFEKLARERELDTRLLLNDDQIVEDDERVLI